MSKKKRRERKKREREDDKLKSKSRKEKKGKRKREIKFELDEINVSAKNVIDDVIDKLKSARRKIKTKSKLKGELVFARDILSVIDEVVTRYDHALTDGTFSTSPVAQYLYQALNYMLAAYNNIEKLLMEKSFDFLDEYYNLRFTHTGKGPKERVQLQDGKLKHGRSGKIHIPLLNKEKRKRTTKKIMEKRKVAEKKRRKKKGGRK